MTQVKTRADSLIADRGDGVVVRRPRATDAIGKALRRAFVPEQNLPCEWTRALNALDRAS